MAILPTYKYESDSGDIHIMRLSSDIGGAGGTEPTGTDVSDIKPKLYKSNREHGIRPRYVTCSLVNGTAPDNYITYKRVPVLTPTSWSSDAYKLGATLAINAVDHKIVARVGEDY